MILNSVLNGLLVWPTIDEENGTTRTKKYEELSVAEKLQTDYDLKATNIVLQGLPPNVYAIVNHHKVAKEIWVELSFLCKARNCHYKKRNVNCSRSTTFYLELPLIRDNRARSQDAGLHCATVSKGMQGQSMSGTRAMRVLLTSFEGKKCREGQEKVVKCYIIKVNGHIVDNREFDQLVLILFGSCLCIRSLLEDNLEGKRPEKRCNGFMKGNVGLKHSYLTVMMSLNAKAVQIAIFQLCIRLNSEVPKRLQSGNPIINDMDNHSVHSMQGFEETLVVDFRDNEIISDSNIISYSQYLQETQQAAVQD
ncbi:hypothetical protein Tco_0470863 [Tanacetum coccineum]